MSRAWCVGILALGCGLAGCGNKDSVSVSGHVESLSLTLEQRTLGTFLAGEFDVVLALGHYASDPVTVRTASFTLVRAETGEELGLGALDLTPTGALLPQELRPDGELRLGYALVATEPVPALAGASLCAGPVGVRGAVEHSLDGGTTTTVSGAGVTPTGCN